MSTRKPGIANTLKMGPLKILAYLYQEMGPLKILDLFVIVVKNKI